MANQDPEPGSELGSGGAEPDKSLTFFSREQADRFRGLVRQAFAERGIEVTVYADHVRDSEQRQFGLWNIAAVCHSEPDGEQVWPQAIARHIQITLATLDSNPFDDMSTAELLSRTYVRLSAPDLHPDMRTVSYARHTVPGLIDLIAHDLPETVAILHDRQVERFGADDLFRAGLANLRVLPIEERERVSTKDGGHFEAIFGASFFTASRVLVMPDLLTQVFGDVEPRCGVIACMPFRHQVALHLIADQSVIPSIQAMVRFAHAGYSDGAGGVSPNVYWWHDGSWQQLSRIDDSGRVAIHVDERFQQVLEAVTR